MLEDLIGRENQGNLIGSLVAIAVFILLYFLLKDTLGVTKALKIFRLSRSTFDR